MSKDIIHKLKTGLNVPIPDDYKTIINTDTTKYQDQIQPKKQYKLYHYRYAFVSVILVLIVIGAYSYLPGTSLNKGISDHNTPQSSTKNTALISEPAATQSPVTTAPQQAVVLNITDFIEAPARQSHNLFCLLGDDFIKMSDVDLCAYFGINMIPSYIPSDFTRQTDNVPGIFRRDNGKGEVYYDVVSVKYSNSSGNQISVVAGTVGTFTFTNPTMVIDGIEYPDYKGTVSTINGIDVTIYHYTDTDSDNVVRDKYMAVYKQNGVDVRVDTAGVSQKEFTEVLLSLLGLPVDGLTNTEINNIDAVKPIVIN